MTPFFQSVALALAALLPIINPPGSSPIFLSMTVGASESTRTALARRVALNAILLLLAAMFVGSYVLLFFGLSLAVIKIAGGLLVISTGWYLIRGPEPQKSEQMAMSAQLSEQKIRDVGFYPLTFPLTIGPGAISVGVTLGAGNHVPGASTLVVTLGTTAGILIAAVTIYLCYRFATRVLTALGETGTTVVLRLSAFILLAVGVQIFCDGLAARFALFSPGRS